MSRSILVLKHVSCEGPDRLESFAAARGVDLDVIDLENGQPLPSFPFKHQAMVVLGGAMNVYQEKEYPFLAPETALIREAVLGGVPYLGLCLGGQLLAKAVGGRVTRNAVKEIGNYSVTLNEAGKAAPLFAGFPETFPVFQWHGDTFSDIATGVRLACSPLCADQAFRFGEKAYGLQFHVEVSLPSAHEWFKAYDPEVHADRLNPGEILQGFEAVESHYARLSDQMFTNFFKIAGFPSAPPR
jgi:GMP synthase-like glutamine amidotransferase